MVARSFADDPHGVGKGRLWSMNAAVHSLASRYRATQIPSRYPGSNIMLQGGAMAVGFLQIGIPLHLPYLWYEGITDGHWHGNTKDLICKPGHLLIH
jgi:hypothetical protein